MLEARLGACGVCFFLKRGGVWKAVCRRKRAGGGGEESSCHGAGMRAAVELPQGDGRGRLSPVLVLPASGRRAQRKGPADGGGAAAASRAAGWGRWSGTDDSPKVADGNHADQRRGECVWALRGRSGATREPSRRVAARGFPGGSLLTHVLARSAHALPGDSGVSVLVCPLKGRAL